ncbi:MAG TPA: aminotransferase class III-fold pyridoxal phosphate-dependent enzyme, partial [Polyangiaceae bacterium]|nr:aminotransferase class III-fold pyridoxal phosphate-dependent enzyme [Polyangiaceae bacterium]
FGDLEALKRSLAENRAAAFVVEPIQAEGGVIMPPVNYLAEARALCKRRGTLFVLDEVQTGLGRTGSLFAYESAGVLPDALVLGKSLGAGMVALSATVTSRELWQKAYGSPEKFDMHGSTYSGNAFACRVGTEVLGELRTGDLVEATRVRGASFLEALRRALLGHPLVRDVRGAGLLVGIELGPTQSTLSQRVLPAMYESISQKVFGQWLALRLLERGIVCQPASQHWNVLRLEPPLTVTDEQLGRTVTEISALLAEYTSLGPLMKDVAQRLGEQYRGGWAFR